MTTRASSRQAIVDAAAELIRSHGVQGTSMSLLAAASHTSAGAIYHHFRNKNEVILEVARTAIAWPLDTIAEYRDSPASPAQLAEYAMGALALTPEIGDLLAQLGAGAGTDDELGKRLRAEFVVLRDQVEATMISWAKANGVPAARVSGYSQLLVGLTLGYATQRMLVDRFDEATYRRQAIALLELVPE